MEFPDFCMMLSVRSSAISIPRQDIAQAEDAPRGSPKIKQTTGTLPAPTTTSHSNKETKLSQLNIETNL
jgi:hypothetical protein